ncbi:MAG: hypothetical protein V9G10_11845 [Candidatus Nanopelagicales bacterium]
MLGEALDRAALAGCVPALEDHDDPLAGLLDPALHLEQFDLQQPLLKFVLAAVQPLGVGVALAPGVDRVTLRADQDRVVHLVPRPACGQAVPFERVVLEVLQAGDDLLQVHHGVDVEVVVAAHGSIPTRAAGGAM